MRSGIVINKMDEVARTKDLGDEERAIVTKLSVQVFQ